MLASLSRMMSSAHQNMIHKKHSCQFLRPLIEQSHLNNTLLSPSHLPVSAATECPLVMKSLSLIGPLGPLENSLCKFSFPSTFLRLAFACSSASTLAVNDAVDAFLIPLLGADTPLDGLGVTLALSTGPSAASCKASAFLRFFFLLDPGAFLRECVRPCPLKRSARLTRRSFSASARGRMVITLSGS